jgi:hypothetical protein
MRAMVPQPPPEGEMSHQSAEAVRPRPLPPPALPPADLPPTIEAAPSVEPLRRSLFRHPEAEARAHRSRKCLRKE